MSYSVNAEGFEGQKIEVRVSFWTGAKLLINGTPASKGSKRGEMVLQRNDGKQVIATWKAQFMALDVPQLIIDGQLIKLVEPLKWYQWIWCGLTFTLAFVGGALGAIVGMIGLSINAKIFRTEWNGVLKYFISGLVSVLAFAAYFIVAIIISMLIGR